MQDVTRSGLRVLVATDGSADASAAVAWVAALPLAASVELRTLSVVTLPRGPLDVPQVHEYHQSLRDEARQAAERARDVLRQRWPHAEAHVVEGDPREAIVRAAADWPADLLVVGARGLGAVARLVLGSVSGHVVHHAPCPVLIVRKP
jgi:nucleotide-binding universal stress UspA family protein